MVSIRIKDLLPELMALERRCQAYIKAAKEFQSGGEFAHLGSPGEDIVLVGLREGLKALRKLKEPK